MPTRGGDGIAKGAGGGTPTGSKKGAEPRARVTSTGPPVRAGAASLAASVLAGKRQVGTTPISFPRIVPFYPRKKLGGFLSGTLRFEPSYAEELRRRGYHQAKKTLIERELWRAERDR